jgi:anthranilate synthase component 1
MKKIIITTTVTKKLADVHTPVGIYLRLRDRFRDTILLESSDHHAAENSYSFICINAIAGIEIRDKNRIEFKLPNESPEKTNLKGNGDLKKLLWEFMQRFETESDDPKSAQFAQGLFGYFTFDAVQFFETIEFNNADDAINKIPVARYRLYQYVIVINHYKDELLLLENKIAGLSSEIEVVKSLINSKDVPVYPFKTTAAETSNMTDND